MAWQDLPSCGRIAPTRAPRVTIAYRKQNASTRLRLAININSALAASLGWQPKGRVRPQIDDTMSRIRLSASESGSTICGTPSGNISVHLSPPWMRDEVQLAEQAEHVIEDGALIITLPAWARPQAPAIAHKPAAIAHMVPPIADKPHSVAPPEPVQTAAAATTADEDEREAEQLVIAGQGARYLADYFGWDLKRAQAFAAKVRAMKAA